MLDQQQSNPNKTQPFPPSGSIIGAFLIKLAKHLALIACLLIIGQPIGRFAVSQLGIFLMVLSAALLHSVGRVLQRRIPLPAAVSRCGS